jgi:hypothetical protein
MNKIIKLSFVATALVGFTGCKKFVDVNDNPNTAINTTASYVFSGALGTTYRNQVSGNVHITPGTWTGYYGHSTSFTGGGAEKTYEYTTADFNAFDGLFDNLSDYQYVRNHADENGVAFLKEPANVMQCYVYQELVDMYGDVPYGDAFKGLDNILPTYAKQKDIYEDLVKRLDAAMSAMNSTVWPTDATVLAADIYFQGNKTNWIRFANTLKLRILMRQSFMPGRDGYITSNINATLSNGFITANVLCSPGYQVIAGKLNPFYNNWGYNELNNIVQNHQYRKMGAAILNFLKRSETTNAIPPSAAPAATANADTFRLQSLAWPNGTSPSAPAANLDNYFGIPMGVGSGYATAGSSPIGPIQVQVGVGTRPGMVMLLAEALFLQAEAAHRYSIAFAAGDPKQCYEAGVISHFRTCAAPGTAGNAANAGDAFAQRYIARPIENIGWTTSTDKIRAILIQKWVSLCNINGLEAWSEYRKSSGSASEGVPNKVRTRAVTSNPEPARYLYPQREYDANGANVPQNIDRFTSKIFWDVN